MHQRQQHPRRSHPRTPAECPRPHARLRSLARNGPNRVARQGNLSQVIPPTFLGNLKGAKEEPRGRKYWVQGTPHPPPVPHPMGGGLPPGTKGSRAWHSCPKPGLAGFGYKGCSRRPPPPQGGPPALSGLARNGLRLSSAPHSSCLGSLSPPPAANVTQHPKHAPPSPRAVPGQEDGACLQGKSRRGAFPRPLPTQESRVPARLLTMRSKLGHFATLVGRRTKLLTILVRQKHSMLRSPSPHPNSAVLTAMPGDLPLHDRSCP